MVTGVSVHVPQVAHHLKDFEVLRAVAEGVARGDLRGAQSLGLVYLQNSDNSHGLAAAAPARDVEALRMLDVGSIRAVIEENTHVKRSCTQLTAELEGKSQELKEMLVNQAKLEEIEQHVEELTKKLQSSSETIQKVQETAAMFKRLYEESEARQSAHHTNGGAARPSSLLGTSAERALALVPGGNEADYKALLEEAKTELLRMREDVKEQNALTTAELVKAREELSQARLARSRLELEAEHFKQQRNVVENEARELRTQLDASSRRAVEFSTIASQLRTEIVEVRALRETSDERLRQAQVQVSVLEREKELLASAEKRASDELSRLSDKVHRLEASSMIYQQTEEARATTRARERKKIEDDLQKLQLEWATTRKSLDAERGHVLELTVARDAAVALADDHARAEAAAKQAHDEAKAAAEAAERRVQASEARCQELEARLKKEEEKTMLALSGKSMISPASPGRGAIDREAELMESVLKMQKEIERLKEELESERNRVKEWKSIAENNEAAAKLFEARHVTYKEEAERAAEARDAEITRVNAQLAALESSSTASLAESKTIIQQKDSAIKGAIEEHNKLKEANLLIKRELVESQQRLQVLQKDAADHHTRLREERAKFERQAVMHAESVKELAQAGSRLRQAEDEIERLSQRAVKSEAELASVQVEFEARIASLASEKESHEKTAVELEQQNQLLLDRIEAMQIAAAEAARKQLDGPGTTVSASATLENFAEREARQVSAEEDLQEVLRYLRRSKQAADTELSLLKQERTRLQKQLEGAKRAVDDALERSKKYETESASRVQSDDKLVALQMKVEQMAVVEQNLRVLREENQQNQRAAEEWRRKAEALQKDTEPLRMTLAQKEMEIGAMAAETVRLKDEVARWHKRVNELIERYRAVDVEEHERVKVNLERVTEAEGHAKLALEALKEEHERGKEELVRAREEQEQVKMELKRAQETAVQAQEELKRAQGAVASEALVKAELGKKLTALEKDKAELQGKVAVLEEQQKTLDQTKALEENSKNVRHMSTQKRLDQLQATIKDLRAKKEGLDKQLQEQQRKEAEGRETWKKDAAATSAVAVAAEKAKWEAELSRLAEEAAKEKAEVLRLSKELAAANATVADARSRKSLSQMLLQMKNKHSALANAQKVVKDAGRRIKTRAETLEEQMSRLRKEYEDIKTMMQEQQPLHAVGVHALLTSAEKQQLEIEESAATLTIELLESSGQASEAEKVDKECQAAYTQIAEMAAVLGMDVNALEGAQAAPMDEDDAAASLKGRGPMNMESEAAAAAAETKEAAVPPPPTAAAAAGPPPPPVVAVEASQVPTNQQQQQQHLEGQPEKKQRVGIAMAAEASLLTPQHVAPLTTQQELSVPAILMPATGRGSSSLRGSPLLAQRPPKVPGNRRADVLPVTQKEETSAASVVQKEAHMKQDAPRPEETAATKEQGKEEEAAMLLADKSARATPSNSRDSNVSTELSALEQNEQALRDRLLVKMAGKKLLKDNKDGDREEKDPKQLQQQQQQESAGRRIKRNWLDINKSSAKTGRGSSSSLSLEGRAKSSAAAEPLSTLPSRFAPAAMLTQQAEGVGAGGPTAPVDAAAAAGVPSAVPAPPSSSMADTVTAGVEPTVVVVVAAGGPGARAPKRPREAEPEPEPEEEDAAAAAAAVVAPDSSRVLPAEEALLKAAASAEEKEGEPNAHGQGSQIPAMSEIMMMAKGKDENDDGIINIPSTAGAAATTAGQEQQQLAGAVVQGYAAALALDAMDKSSAAKRQKVVKSLSAKEEEEEEEQGASSAAKGAGVDAASGHVQGNDADATAAAAAVKSSQVVLEDAAEAAAAAGVEEGGPSQGMIANVAAAAAVRGGPGRSTTTGEEEREAVTEMVVDGEGGVQEEDMDMGGEVQSSLMAGGGGEGEAGPEEEIMQGGELDYFSLAGEKEEDEDTAMGGEEEEEGAAALVPVTAGGGAGLEAGVGLGLGLGLSSEDGGAAAAAAILPESGSAGLLSAAAPQPLLRPPTFHPEAAVATTESAHAPAAATAPPVAAATTTTTTTTTLEETGTAAGLSQSLTIGAPPPSPLVVLVPPLPVTPAANVNVEDANTQTQEESARREAAATTEQEGPGGGSSTTKEDTTNMGFLFMHEEAAQGLTDVGQGANTGGGGVAASSTTTHQHQHRIISLSRPSTASNNSNNNNNNNTKTTTMMMMPEGATPAAALPPLAIATSGGGEPPLLPVPEPRNTRAQTKNMLAAAAAAAAAAVAIASPAAVGDEGSLGRHKKLNVAAARAGGSGASAAGGPRGGGGSPLRKSQAGKRGQGVAAGAGAGGAPSPPPPGPSSSSKTDDGQDDEKSTKNGEDREQPAPTFNPYSLLEEE